MIWETSKGVSALPQIVQVRLVPKLHEKFGMNLKAVKIMHTLHTPPSIVYWHAFSPLCFPLEFRILQALEHKRGQGKTSSCCVTSCCSFSSLAFICVLVLVWHVGHFPLPGIFWLMGLNFRNNFWNVLICFMKHISITHLKYACEGFYTALLWQGVETENSHRLVAAQSGVL